MADKLTKIIRDQLDRLAPILIRLPWSDFLSKGWDLIRKHWQVQAEQGLYEVLEYESKLELLDTKGRRAQFTKREKVRYVQNNIIAYQDHAWGDGKILLRYRCSPGEEVDRYQIGHRTFLLISLRDSKKHDDEDELNMEWGISDGFVQSHESWETEIRHKTKNVKAQMIFPKSRPPRKYWLEEVTRGKRSELERDSLRQLPDKRYQLTWQMKNPLLSGRYQVHWTW